jgi:hypothetical protein
MADFEIDVDNKLIKEIVQLKLGDSSKSDGGAIEISGKVDESGSSRVTAVLTASVVTEGTILINSTSDLKQFEEALKGKTVLAVDAEGVKLSRMGKMTVFSVAVSDQLVFLVDTIHPDVSLREAAMNVLKSILEDESVEKIIHDCRQDSDALYHVHSIAFRNVFDTQVYYLAISGSTKRAPLNIALEAFGCKINKLRNNIDYRTEPEYWGKRPLTPEMIDCASGDVKTLFDLRKNMYDRVVANPHLTIENLRRQCNEALDEFRGLACHGTVAVPANKIPLVIGKGGANISKIEKRNGGIVSCNISLSGNAKFLLLGRTQEIVEKMKRSIMDCCR